MTFQVYFSDGTIPNFKRGYYWREEMGGGHFGGSHGPFETKETAEQDSKYYADWLAQKARRRV